MYFSNILYYYFMCKEEFRSERHNHNIKQLDLRQTLHQQGVL